MKTPRLLLWIALAATLAGCASTDRRVSEYALNRAPNDTGIFHDYDYRTDGSVGPYVPPRIK